jgi:chitin disaccharide deacetylase
MRRLIVNADDFGLTVRVNDAIVEGHCNGIITSTTLMANGAAFDSAVALAARTPSLGVGIHLNLTEGRPLADAATVRSLLDERGRLRGAGSLARGVMSGSIRRADVERELRFQIEKVLAAGVSPTHLDAHKHVHILPPVFDVVLRLAQEYGVRAVRRAVERSVGLLSLLRRNAPSSVAIVKQYLSARAMGLVGIRCRAKLRRAGLLAPARFYGITQTGFLDASSLQVILRHVSEGTSEIMCHPGYVDADLKKTPTRLLIQRERELAALVSPEVRGLVKALNIELIHYGQLAGSQ